MVGLACRPMSAQVRRVILASSLGTLFEWYDFYLYGALAGVMAKQFFAGLDDGAAFIFALLAFAAGFVVRPFGALVFGRLGDLIGRKYTFLVTILIMGLATFMVGVLPSYSTIGVAAPVFLIVLRLLQGLALGGEYAGAAIYVAEHAPDAQRGSYTAWVQTTATLGLLLSLLLTLGVRHLTGDAAFDDWGWRIPFIVSAPLLAVSVYIRLSLEESPAFLRMKRAGKASRAPLADSFGQWSNLRLVLLALFGLTAGQAVVWYCSQFYALFFLTQTLKVDPQTAQGLMAVALLAGTPLFLLFGALSDRIGRKPLIMSGLLLAALTYFPAFHALTWVANPGLARAQAATRVLVRADPQDCSFQFNLLGTAHYNSSCDIAKQALAGASVSYDNQPAGSGETASILVGDTLVPGYTPRGLAGMQARERGEAFRQSLAVALAAAGYPQQADMRQFSHLKVLALLLYLVLLSAMVYGPIGACLVEMFPTRIRYTSVSLPYHIGNGWFGGLLPTTAFAVVAQSGNMYSGLWYPVVIAGLTCVIGVLFLSDRRSTAIYAGA